MVGDLGKKLEESQKKRNRQLCEAEERDLRQISILIGFTFVFTFSCVFYQNPNRIYSSCFHFNKFSFFELFAVCYRMGSSRRVTSTPHRMPSRLRWQLGHPADRAIWSASRVTICLFQTRREGGTSTKSLCHLAPGGTRLEHDIEIPFSDVPVLFYRS